MTEFLQKIRVPLGPLLADGVIVASLIFTAGQMLNRFEAMDARLAEIEKDKLSERTALAEQRLNAVEQALQLQRLEIIRRLDRIEDKLDNKVDRAR